jgi:hypothetical protein
MLCSFIFAAAATPHLDCVRQKFNAALEEIITLNRLVLTYANTAQTAQAKKLLVRLQQL